MVGPQALVFAPDALSLPDAVREWCQARALSLASAANPEEVRIMAIRGRPQVVIIDARSSPATAIRACSLAKRDPFSGVVPCVVLVAQEHRWLAQAFAADADEVITSGLSAEEVKVRLDGMLHRAQRDVYVHPSTRLPGAPAIDAEINKRLATGERFAVCYADLDYFKEYNDRYSYHEGDRVIRTLATILHDVVRGYCDATGFVGHIGGDDFICIVPIEQASEVCEEIVATFDAIVPYQYSEQDRRAGYYFGKDRRGQLHRVPLMTLSIGVVTNDRRHFTGTAQVSELATEMKSYAKTLTGSVYVVDRRQDPSLEAATADFKR